ncbi:MAG: hypothetical protein N3D71_07705 [Burkholderiaceae bacterium]|nr:hypothetical protein [Burkholderiaceae bacterium]
MLVIACSKEDPSQSGARSATATTTGTTTTTATGTTTTATGTTTTAAGTTAARATAAARTGSAAGARAMAGARRRRRRARQRNAARLRARLHGSAVLGDEALALLDRSQFAQPIAVLVALAPRHQLPAIDLAIQRSHLLAREKVFLIARPCRRAGECQRADRDQRGPSQHRVHCSHVRRRLVRQQRYPAALIASYAAALKTR